MNNATRTTAMQCFVISMILLTLAAFAGGGDKLMTRHLWMDEVHSWLLLTDPDQSRAMQALADGVDFNPPGWFLVTRWLAGSPEAATEFQFRAICLLWTVLSVAGLCILLSKQFDRIVICAAVILTVSQPLLIHHATEIRFYGFWNACCIWLCVLIQWHTQSLFARTTRAVGITALGLAICTSHYFGIISLGLILLGIIWQRRPGWVGSVTPAIIGMSIGLACWLQFLPGQKASLTRPTWISPATLPDTIGFLLSLFPLWQVVVCLIALCCSIKSLRRPGCPNETAEIKEQLQQPSNRSLLPFLSLSAMPLVIVVIAWCIQPSLVTRYALIGLPPFAIFAAAILQKCGNTSRKSVLLAATIGFSISVAHRSSEWSKEEDSYLHVVDQLRSLAPHDVILFEDRISWMAILHRCPQLKGQCFLADFEDEQLPADSSLRIVQRDVGRRVEKWYPQFAMKSLRQMNSVPVYYVIPYSGQNIASLLRSETHHPERHSNDIFRCVVHSPDNEVNHGAAKNCKETF